jgi:hypothetical protein
MSDIDISSSVDNGLSRAQAFTSDKFPKDSATTSGLDTVGAGMTALANALKLAIYRGAQLGGASTSEINTVLANAAPVFNILSAVGLGANVASNINEIARAYNEGDEARFLYHLSKLCVGVLFAIFAVAVGWELPAIAAMFAIGQFVFSNLDVLDEYAKKFLSLINAALDPLVLDLNGDGVQLVDSINGVHFDFAGDQFAELTGWVSQNDGFLVIDKNGNGKIDNISEMFGNPIWDPKESIQTGSATIDGFAALAALDTNQDGKIDASDAQFAELQVWQDLNQNGITDPGEFRTLAELEIISIDLQATDSDTGATGNETSDIGTATQVGNVVTATSTYTNADGSTGVIADVSFDRETAGTVYIGEYTLSLDALVLPQLVGYGTLKPLFIAMGESTQLLQLMQGFSASPESSLDLVDQIKAILYEWAGVDDKLADYAYQNTYATTDVSDQIFLDQFMGQIWWQNRQSFIDLPRNQALLAWIGTWHVGGMWAGAPGNSPNVLEGMDNLAHTLEAELALRLLIQGPWKSLFPNLHYNLATDSFTGTIDSSSISLLLANAPAVGAAGDVTALKAYWGLLADEISIALNYVTVDAGLMPALINAAVSTGLSASVAEALFANEDHHLINGTLGDDTVSGTAGIDLVDGGAGNDLISASFGNDTISGATGDDTLNGGAGDDAYYYIRGDGHDTITELWAEGFADSLFLVGVVPAQITGIRNGNDITLVIAESAPGAGDGGSITITNGLEEYVWQGIEQITFSDGTVWTPLDVRNLADTLTASDENIIGLKANDNYSYTRGGGHDTISEAWVNGFDTMALHNVATGSVSLVQNGDDLLLFIAETSAGAGDGGSILLKASLNDYVQEGVEQVTFDDGTIWSRETIRQMLLAQSSTSGNDAITGFNSADVITGGQGNDTYVYHRGDGHDIIDESSIVSGTDTLTLVGIAPLQIKVVKDGENLAIVIAESSPGAGDGGSIVLLILCHGLCITRLGVHPVR